MPPHLILLTISQKSLTGIPVETESKRTSLRLGIVAEGYTINCRDYKICIYSRCYLKNRNEIWKFEDLEI